ncbi:MAG: GreA/GreB family elongation factor [Flavobacteriia bacterium]|nr:GreA/GreB family elongation factor [Flavobacteriia bacterium]
MKQKQIILCQTELKIIKHLIRNISEADNILNNCISKLKSEIENALVYADSDLPADVVRINSIVDVNTPFGEKKIQLVLPKNSNSIQKRISLLTPMGSAIIGYKEGAELNWLFPNGEYKVKILRVNNSENNK